MSTESQKKANRGLSQPKMTQVEKIISEMLKENTGAHFLDSGSVYGRHWEKNQKIQDFRDLPEATLNYWGSETEVSVSLFHFLVANLQVNKTTKKLEGEFYRFAETKENEDKSYYEIEQEFAEDILEKKYGYEVHQGYNSYNNETLLDQVIQGHFFNEDSDGESSYIIMSIHNGCDVRGGYTKPRIFWIRDMHNFLSGMTDISLRCDCTSVYSDDCGYNYYLNHAPENLESEIKDNKIPKFWIPKPVQGKDPEMYNDLYCSNCGKKVEPFAYLVEW